MKRVPTLQSYVSLPTSLTSQTVAFLQVSVSWNKRLITVCVCVCECECVCVPKQQHTNQTVYN